MPIKYVCPRSLGELSNPIDRHEQAMEALVTAGALVALADGRVDAIERDEAVDYIDRHRLAPAISRQRLAEFFDARVRRLDDRDFASLIVDAFRPVAGLSLASDMIRIAERVAAADGRIHPSEVQVITLLRLIMMTPSESKDVDPAWKK
jgi:tellurite resistance protein TerB